MKQFSKMFDKIFDVYCGDCYILEFNMDTKCTNNDYTCQACLGTGYLLMNVYKTKVLIDKGLVMQGIPNVNKEIQSMGKYYKDSRTAYFKKDCNFDLSPNVYRMVLNIVNNQIIDVFGAQYFEPITANGEIVFYETGLSSNNIRRSDFIKTFNKINNK